MTSDEEREAWVPEAEWRMCHRSTETSANGQVQFRVVIYESRWGLPKLRGLIEFWVRVTTPGGGVDYQPNPGTVFRFEYDASELVGRVVREHLGLPPEGKD